jgi:hypothetical protein
MLSTNSYANGLAVGSSSIILQTNKIPLGGTCNISQTNGTAYETEFTIWCENWIDVDGYVAEYSFFAYYYDDSINYGLGYNSIGNLTTQLPQGAAYDSNRLYIYVQIIDNENGVTIFNFTNPMFIDPPNSSVYAQNLNDLLSQNQYSSKVINLNTANTIQTIQTLTNAADMLNAQSFADQKAVFGGTDDSYLVPISNGPEATYSGIVAVIFISFH